MSGWYVVRAKPNQENWAIENITRQGGEVYAPKIKERGKLKFLFPRYVFVRVVTQQWRFLLSTFGVSTVMMVGDRPAVVSDGELSRIRSTEVEGVVKLPNLQMKVGDAIRITEGPYAGFTGLYAGCGPKDRERILLDYLGRKTPVLIDPKHLSIA